MPFSGTTFSVINSFVGGTVILSSQVNQNYSDIASGLTAIASGTQYLTKVELGNASDTTLARVSAGRVSIEGGAGSLYLATIDLGSATDTTLARSGAGDVSIEGNVIYRAGGTDVPVTDGGTGSSTAGGARTNLGLGTAAVQNTGTSGANVPLLNTGVTWSGGIATFGGSGSANGVAASFNATMTGNSAAVVDVTLNGSPADDRRLIRFIYSSAEQGSVQKNGLGVTYFTSSDGRLKENRRPILDSGDIIDALEPIYFKWKGIESEDFGFIAQDAHAVHPLFASQGSEQGPGEEGFNSWKMEHGRMEAILVAEIKALRKRLQDAGL